MGRNGFLNGFTISGKQAIQEGGTTLEWLAHKKQFPTTDDTDY
jgi:hypothetical protein